MRIVVCSAQAVFMRGGLEQLAENLTAALVARGHEAEQVRLPVAWDRRGALESAFAWRLLGVGGDMAIALNFPAYYIRHPRKVVWLAHQHRPAYDAVDAPWSDYGLDDDSLEAQRLLTDWDTRTLEEAERIYTISARVTERLRTYNGLESEPLYHPAPLAERIRSGSMSGPMLAVSRLELNKRPDLAVRGALAAGARLAVAGSGSMRAELQRMIEGGGSAESIRLLGFVDDTDLIDRLADCRAVVYTPLDEDYGYVTLQAYLARKPVITTTDSGGVLEWVEDGVTGLVVEPDPAAIGRAMCRLDDDESLARRLGEAGYARARELSWDPVVDRLLGA